MRPFILAAAALAALPLAGPASAEITVGVAGPMTGALAPLGLQMRDGAEAAVAAINAAGGVLGEDLVLQVEDDACDPDEAIAAANRLVAAGAVFVAGHLCSEAAIAASFVYDAAGIVEIAPGAPDPRFTEERPGPGVFRLFGRTDRQAEEAAAYLARRYPNGRIAIFDDGTAYGRSLADGVSQALDAAGITPSLTDSFSAAAPRTAALVDRLDVRLIDAVFVGAYPAGLAALAVEIAGRGLATEIVAGDTAADPAFVEAAGAAAEGTAFTFQPPVEESPAAAGAAAAIRAAGAAAGMALYAYASVEVWAEAAEAAGTTAYRPVANAVAARTFLTVLGPVGFDANGNATLPGWVVYRWQDGRYRPAE